MSGSGAEVGVVGSWGKTLQPQHVVEAGPGHTLPPASSLRTWNRLGPAVTCL